jgi:hypothetical protein
MPHQLIICCLLTTLGFSAIRRFFKERLKLKLLKISPPLNPSIFHSPTPPKVVSALEVPPTSSVCTFPVAKCETMFHQALSVNREYSKVYILVLIKYVMAS